jgi:hypothetical protein
MRGLFLVLALLGFGALSACENTSGFPAVPVTLTLKTDYRFLPAGTHSLLLALPSNNLPEFSIITQPLGEEVLSVPEKNFREEMDFENRDMIYSVQGTAEDGTVIEGKFTSGYAYICEPKNLAGHRSCSDGNDYHFVGDLKRNGEVIGTIEGDVKR